MRTVCAWCQKEYKSSVSDRENSPINHGICANCLVDLEYNTIEIGQFLNTFDLPLLVVDGNAVVQNANKVALEFLKKTGEDIHNTLAGDVISCVYADLPEGCGHTVHCDGCAIRNAVEETYRTGESSKTVEAFQYLKTPVGPQRIKIYISTEKVGERVFLQLETMKPTAEHFNG